MTIKNIYIQRLISDADLKTITGDYLDDGYIIHAITSDVNVYDKDTNQLLVSFRKRRLKSNNIAWDNLSELAVAARGRGAAAGPINPHSTYWKKRKLIKTKKFKTSYLKPDGNPSKMFVSNQVCSTPIGYYEAMKAVGSDLPCRYTYHTAQKLKKYQAGIPYIQEVDKWFKKLYPVRHGINKTRASQRPKYQIENTAFSTITINRNFRTGLHKDAGDFGGYAMLSVLERGQYNGGLFMIPAYGIGIDLREGDIMCVKVSEYHANTEIWTTPEQDKFNDELPLRFKLDTQVGTLGLEQRYSRISFVSYLREKLIRCDK
tara:strand:+ start:1345 stop:2295 length:951 start_codon:yes stop_codon:yes gene_type:complete